jgi:hypothetical protein
MNFLGISYLLITSRCTYAYPYYQFVVKPHTYIVYNFGEFVLCTWKLDLFFKLGKKVFEFENMCQN